MIILSIFFIWLVVSSVNIIFLYFILCQLEKHSLGVKNNTKMLMGSFIPVWHLASLEERYHILVMLKTETSREEIVKFINRV